MANSAKTPRITEKYLSGEFRTLDERIAARAENRNARKEKTRCMGKVVSVNKPAPATPIPETNSTATSGLQWNAFIAKYAPRSVSSPKMTSEPLKIFEEGWKTVQLGLQVAPRSLIGVLDMS